MTAFGLYPEFTDRAGYKAWRASWSQAYKTLSRDIMKRKQQVKALNRSFDKWYQGFETENGGKPYLNFTDPKGMPEEYMTLAKAQADLLQYRAMAKKMMTLLDEAKQRRDRILQMHKDLVEQEKLFPLDLGECRNIDFHFNKGHMEFPFLPMWAIRAKGRSYYLNEVTFDAPCTTHERTSGSTKGVLRFSRAQIVIEKGAVARIETKFVDQTKEVA